MVNSYFDLGTQKHIAQLQIQIKENLLLICEKISKEAGLQKICPLLKQFIDKRCDEHSSLIIENPMKYVDIVIEFANYACDLFNAYGISNIDTIKNNLLKLILSNIMDTFKNYIIATDDNLKEATYILDNLYDGVLAIDVNSRKIITSNKAIVNIFKTENLIGKDVLEFVPNSRKAYYEDLFLKFVDQQKGITEVLQFKTANNEILYLEASVNLLNKDTMIAVFRDITARFENEKVLMRINRLYEVLSRINNLVVRVQTADDLFKSVCNILVEFGQFRLAWIGCVDAKTKTIKPKVHAGDKKYLRNIIVSIEDDKPEGLGPSAVAIRENRIVVCNNILTSPQMGPWREQAKASKFRSSITVPISLLETNSVTKVLKAYSSEIAYFDEKEIKLFEEIASDISYALDFLEKKKKVSYLSSFDPLTNLPNRLTFSYTIETLIKAKRNFSILICDINNFTALNNKYGYIKGDYVIKIIAKNLLELDNIYHVARSGNDEFGIILNVTDKDKIIEFAQNINKKIQQLDLNNINFNISFTIGASIYPTDTQEAEKLITNAEIALIQAKKSNFFISFYSKELNIQIQQVLTYQNKIKTAIHNNEFLLYYQPKLILRDFSIKSCEALLRWQTQDKLLMPKDFIGILEETKLINKVGLHVFENALKQISEWKNKGQNISIAVNVSAVQLNETDFVKEILQLLSQYETSKDLIEIEITESVLIEHLEKLNQLHQYGLNIVIDDFGTGYSSLSYLQKMPVSAIKIDISFVREMFKGKNLEILQTIINLAKVLNLKTIAEGVETIEQLNALVGLRCDEIQGFLVSKPLPPKEIEHFFKKDFVFHNWLSKI